MDRDTTVDYKPKKVTGAILTIVSLCLLAGAVVIYRKHCAFFHSMNTINFSAHFLTFDVANVMALVVANLKHIIGVYLKGYILPVYLMLFPGILCLGAGISQLTGKELNLFAFLSEPKKEKAFLVSVFIFAFIAILLVHFLVLLDYPYASDEFSYLFQSKMMASGKITSPAPSPGESFNAANIVVNNGRWYSKYTLGMPLLLAPGSLVGMPFLINALLAAMTLLFIYHITAMIFNKNAGAIAALFVLFSPYFILQGATYFPHTASGFFAVLLIYSVIKFQKEETWKWTVLAGLSLCLLLLIRPADAGIITIGVTPWFLYILYKSKNRWDVFRKMLAAAGGIALGMGIIFLVNYIQNGDPLLFSFVKYRSYDKWGFGKVGHTPIKGLWNISFSYLRMGFWIMPFITIGALLSLFMKKMEPWFLAISPVGFILFYFNFFALGNVEFGARYYYPAFLFMAVMAAGGLEGAGEKLKLPRWLGNKNTVYACLLLSILFTITGVFPALLPPIRKQYSINKKVIAWLRDPLKSNEKTITIIRDAPDKMVKTLIRNPWKYQNQKNLSAIYLSPETNSEVVKNFPHRKVYLVYFDYGKKRFDIAPFTGKEPENPGDYILAGINYKNSLADVESAEKCFKKAVELSNGNPSALFNLGYLYFETEKPGEGVKVFEEIIKKAPNYDSAYYYLGRCLGDMGRKKDAATVLKAFIEKFPNSSLSNRAKDHLRYYSISQK